VERRTQARFVVKRLETCIEGSLQETAKGRWSWVSPWSKTQREVARLATLGTATLGELKRLGQKGVPPPAEQERAIEMLALLRPEWLSNWAETLVDIAPRNWRLARRLVREGLSRKPTSAGYTLGMLERASFHWGKGAAPLADQLLEDRALLEDEVFRLFEVEGAGELSLGAHDKYSSSIHSWEEALAVLAVGGHLPRPRLLDASLDALSRDLPQFQAGWFSRFHERLAPTLEERIERHERYSALLTSRIPPKVSFALEALVRVDASGRPRSRELCEQLRPALRAPSRKTAAAAVKLLARIAHENADLRPAALLALTEALSHERPDVQDAALKVIEKHGSRNDSHLLAAMNGRAAGVASSVRSRVCEWIGSAALVKADPAAFEAVAPLPARTVDVVPIDDIDELIDACAHILEQPDRPDEIERVLAGVSLLCDAAPEEVGRRAAPLLKRARALVKDADRNAPLAAELARVVVAWLTGETPERLSPSPKMDVPAFLSARLEGLVARVASRRPAPLLAAPTRTDGVLAPLSLVDRLKKTTAPEPHDLVVAFLRLGREGRPDALRAAREVDGEVGRALRHALGDPEAEVGPTAWLWIAAARARDPGADDPRVEARHGGLGPGAGRAGRVLPRLRHRVNKYQDRGREKTVTYYWIECDRAPALPKEVPLLHLPVLLHSLGPRAYVYAEGVAGSDENMIRWALSLWPEWKEPLFVEGAERISSSLDWGERGPDRAFLEPLAEPWTPLQGSALLLLSVALAAKWTKIQGLAVDALVAGIAERRLDPSLLGECMSELLPTGLIKPPRWAKSLSDAARTSRDHTAAVATIIQRALRGAPPRDIGSLLAVLVELLAELGRRVDDAEAAAYIRVLAGKSGSAAKAARSLLA
jgi:hypothetical protein